MCGHGHCITRCCMLYYMQWIVVFQIIENAYYACSFDIMENCYVGMMPKQGRPYIRPSHRGP